MGTRIGKRTTLYGLIAILLASLLGALSYHLAVYRPQTAPPVSTPNSALLATFSSTDSIKSFLSMNSRNRAPFLFFGPNDVSVAQVRLFLDNAPASAVTASGLSGVAPFVTAPIYSTTNIQVTGVDEVDIVKTDGEHIYLASDEEVLIVKAFPPEEAEILSTLTFGDANIVGIFVNRDSNRLTVIGSKYNLPESSYPSYYIIDTKTFACVYDISEKSTPVLLRNFTMTGSYFNSRMIGDYVYFVVSQPAWIVYDTVILPKIYFGEQIIEIDPTQIRYSNGSDDYYQYTTFVAMNMQNPAEPPTYITLLLGGTSSMYVSTNNMYVTFPETDGNTTIFRVRIQANNLTCEANGKVFGRELNQFSMDEHNSYFRIATSAWTNGTSSSNLFVLDMNLSIIGTLPNIEPGETLDSARFLGERCYLSTSVVRRDPFFVIDMANASQPKILGYLKIPGFTRYLHPYDENHIIGVGRDETNRVKIDLFDVSNVSAPQNMSEYKVTGGWWSDTPVLSDHKAFLFDYNKSLLAIPASYEYYENYTYTVNQGLYVFNITLSEGIVYRGTVSHQGAGASYLDNRYSVTRSLFIEDVLYTISQAKLKLNNLDTLEQLGEIIFP